MLHDASSVDVTGSDALSLSVIGGMVYVHDQSWRLKELASGDHDLSVR